MPKKSDVWQHFTRETDGHGNVVNKARCKYCTDKKEFETKDGTTNLWKHFRKFHPQEADAAEVVATAAQQPPLPGAPSGSNSASTGHEPMLNEDESLQMMFQRQFKSSTEKVQDMGAALPLQQQQQTTPQLLPSLAQDDEAMQQFPLLPLGPGHGGSSHRESSGLQEEACKHLARMIALRGYDASVLEDDCFSSFVRRLNPEFEVPSRVAIEEMCDGIFDEARRDLLSRLKNAPARVSVAMGKAKTIEAGEVLYTACHFIDDEWNLRKLVLTAAFVKEAVGGWDGHPILGVHLVAGLIHSFLNMVGVLLFHGIQRPSMVAYDDNFHRDDVKYIGDKIHCPTNLFVDNVLHEIAGCLLPCSEFVSDQLDAIEDLTRQTRQQLLSHCVLDNPWIYNKSWYSCYCSIKITLHKEGYSSLDDENIASLLCKVWGKIHQAIQRIFASTSNMCLGELFNVREVLQSELDKPYINSARQALDKAIRDSYLIWSVPFVLDPRCKLKRFKSCFEGAFGSEQAAKYVSKVTTRLSELYDIITSNSMETSLVQVIQIM